MENLKFGNRKLNNYIVLAKDFLNRGMSDKAVEILEKAQEFASDYTDRISILFEIADIYIVKSDYYMALGTYEKIIMIEDSTAGAYYGRALSKEQLGYDYLDIINDYEKAIAIDPNYDMAYYCCAHQYHCVGRDDKCIDYLKRAIEIDARAQYFIDLSSFYEETRKYDDAIKIISDGLDLYPSSGRLLFNKAVVLKLSGDFEGAFSYYRESLKFWENPDTYLNISALMIEKGEIEKSVKWLICGIGKHPQRLILHYNLACCYAKLGNFKEALNALNDAAALDRIAIDWAVEDPDLEEIIKYFTMEVHSDNN